MSKASKARARALRVRVEIARLRAKGGLSSRVLVDGPSLLEWCSRSGANYSAILRELVEAADLGERALVIVAPSAAPQTNLPPPHLALVSAAGVAPLLRGGAFATMEVPSLPSVVVADVKHSAELLDSLEGGALNVLDIASGRLWDGDVRDKFDFDHAAAEGLDASRSAAGSSDELAALVAAPAATGVKQPHVACAFHREGDHVVLDEVAVDDGVRRRVVGHAAGLRLLHEVVATGATPVMTSSMDVLDALRDANEPLPARVEDPALACKILEPDNLSLPPGVSRPWRGLLASARPSSVRPPLDLVLDELPALHQELREALRAESLLSLYDDDVCATLPRFAALETCGFYVDDRSLAHDLAHLETEMTVARDVILAGARPKLLDIDLVRADKQVVGQYIRLTDGSLPTGWRYDDELLDRYAVVGNVRAQAAVRLRALDAISVWMKKLEGKKRLRTVLEPSSTGRWYPHGEATSSIPKHVREAMLLREHLVPQQGHVFVSGDYAAFEPRLLAHQSQDPVLLQGCAPAHDVYNHLMPLIGTTDRDMAKKALLAFMYGESSRVFSSKLPLSMPDGYNLYKRLEAALKDALAFRRGVHETNKLSASSLFGWRRMRGETPALKFRGQAFNLKMQGSAADLLRKLLRDLHAALPPQAWVVHQEFDAVIVTCPEQMAVAVEAILKHTMENVAALSVPLVAKTRHGATLADVS